MTKAIDEATRAIIDQASEWVIHMNEGDASAADIDSFCDWLRRSPVHVREYLRAEAVWAGLEFVDPGRQIDIELLLGRGDGIVVEMPQHGYAGGVQASQPARWHRPFIAAASFVGALMLGVFIWQSVLPENYRYETGLGEQRRLVLDDGSIVDMNTLSEIEVRLTASERLVRLKKGEAYFTVAKESERPFVVESRQAEVRALGTQFNVYNRPGEVLVTVVEGLVAVRNATRDDREAVQEDDRQFALAAVELGAGQQIAVAPSTLGPKLAADTRKSTAWRERRLYFDNQPLSEVVVEFNRYNARRLVIDDPLLARQRIVAVFNADQPDALVRFLTQEHRIEAVSVSENRLVIRPVR